MKLSKLLEGLEYRITAGNSDVELSAESIEVKNVINDNRKIEEGSLFICIKGANFDGHSCAADAAANAVHAANHTGTAADVFAGTAAAGSDASPLHRLHR